MFERILAGLLFLALAAVIIKVVWDFRSQGLGLKRSNDSAASLQQLTEEDEDSLQDSHLE